MALVQRLRMMTPSERDVFVRQLVDNQLVSEHTARRLIEGSASQDHRDETRAPG